MGNCVLCQSSKLDVISKKVRDSNKHRVVKCKNCTHIQLYPVPSYHSYKKFYDDNRQIKNIKFNFKINQLEKKSKHDVERRMKFIQKNNSKKHRILEIGSGNGFLLKRLYNQGYNITGIEISKERREISKKISDAQVIDHNVFNGPESLRPFDTVMMFQVLEHIPQPINFLNQLKRFLKKDGTVIIEVPNVNDFQLELNQAYKNWFWQKAHINYFSHEILTKVLKKSGFHEIKINGVQRYSIENMFNWKITNKPQPINPTYKMPQEYEWIESHYKKYLQKNLKCDTITAVAKK